MSSIRCNHKSKLNFNWQMCVLLTNFFRVRGPHDLHTVTIKCWQSNWEIKECLRRNFVQLISWIRHSSPISTIFGFSTSFTSKLNSHVTQIIINKKHSAHDCHLEVRLWCAKKITAPYSKTHVSYKQIHTNM